MEGGILGREVSRGRLIYLDNRQYSYTLQLIINALWGVKSLKILILEKVI